MKRPEIQETVMLAAGAISHRSTCSRLHVGCIIADHRGAFLRSGYNGAPPGMPHCNHENSTEPCRISTHAEVNAICQAARHGVRIENAHLYTTHEPCYDCSKLIIQSGITVVYYGSSHTRNSGLSLLHQAKIQIYQVNVGPYESFGS